ASWGRGARGVGGAAAAANGAPTTLKNVPRRKLEIVFMAFSFPADGSGAVAAASSETSWALFVDAHPRPYAGPVPGLELKATALIARRLSASKYALRGTLGTSTCFNAQVL